jgi:hypothetical protein
MILGCNSAGNSNELSRKEARKLVDKYPEFASVQRIPLQEAGLIRTGNGQDAGAVEGLWAVQVSPFGARSRILTAKGQQFFTNNWMLVTPAKREVVEITGISDEPLVKNIKIAEFTWHFVELPSVVARYTGQGNKPHDGKAEFQLYDDGWRVKGIHTAETGRQAFLWTKDLEDQAESQYRQIQEAEKAKLDWERNAKTPNRTIATYKGSCENAPPYALTITNATVSVNVGPGPPKPEEVLGYWEQLDVWEPRERSPGCNELEIRTPLNVVGPHGAQYMFVFLSAEGTDVLNRARGQILQALKDWRQKYPDIH